MAPELDLLGGEPVRLPPARDREPDLRRRRTLGASRRWLWVVAVALTVGAAGVVADGTMRAREGAEVARCERQLQAATGHAERRLGLVSNYLEPTVTAGGRVQQLHLADLMSARAGRVLPGVQRADRLCSDVRVRPWHFSLVDRQSAATAYSAALVTLVQIVAAQGTIPLPDDATLQRLRDRVGIGGG
jgi:hypothetical protein